jgi:hypothetical protein
MAEQARYLYAISRGLDAASLAGESGLGESPVEVVSQGGLDAVVSTVDLAEFGEEALRRRLEEWHEAMTAVLDRIDGRSEWSVKVVLPSRPATEPAQEAEGTSGPGSGAAYLMRKKRETELRASADQDAAAQADRVYDALGAASVAGRRLQPQDPRLSGHQGTMTLNAAFLVDDDPPSEFTDAVAAITPDLPDGALQVAGPWPPYSFATLDES